MIDINLLTKIMPYLHKYACHIEMRNDMVEEFSEYKISESPTDTGLNGIVCKYTGVPVEIIDSDKKKYFAIVFDYLSCNNKDNSK